MTKWLVFVLATLAIQLTFASPIQRFSNSAFEINWHPCSNDLPERLECGGLEVPIDWNKPEEGNVTLVLSRVRATTNTPSERRGSLVINTGGPGAPAFHTCTWQVLGSPTYSEAIARHFDIICADPRGVGFSSPVKCDARVWGQNTTIFPNNFAEFEQMVRGNREKGESCLNMTGPLLKHIDTASAARDIEAIRLALNDGKLNYAGFSYGTQLGAAYAELYPENIRTMALDGIVDHSQSMTDVIMSSTTNHEKSLNRFFDWCAANATACGIQADNLPELFDKVVAAADKTPIPAPGCEADAKTAKAGKCRTTVTGSEIRFNIRVMLMSRNDEWSELGLALKQTIEENNATLLASTVETGNNPLLPIACLDWLRYDVSNMTKAFTELQQLKMMAEAYNPHTGSASVNWEIQSRCTGWPVDVVNPQHELDQRAMRKAPPILLVNSQYDDATSYIWATRLKEQMPNSVLVTREGDGHTSYTVHGEVGALFDAYLVNGTLPADGLVVGT